MRKRANIITINNILVMLLQSLEQFRAQTKSISFAVIAGRFEQFSKQDLNKFFPKYVPYLQEYSLDLDQHKREEEGMRKVPAFDGKRSFYNDENIHRRVLDLFRQFMQSSHKNLCQFLRLTTDISTLSFLLSKIEILRLKNSQFNLLYYLFIAGRKSIRLYLKLREEIIRLNTFQKGQYLPISIHNKSKYAEKYVFLDSVVINAKGWKEIVNFVGFQYDSQFLELAFSGRNNITAVELIEFCLWMNLEYANNSPTK